MTKLKIFIGLLIVFSYLCPFVSCNNSADLGTPITVDSTVTAAIARGDSGAMAKNLKKDIESHSIMEKIFFPDRNSISGIGEVASVEDNTGARFLLVSFLLSITSAFPFRFLEAGKRRIGMIVVNIIFFAAFILYTSQVDQEQLLWGVWVLLTLLLVQLLLEIRFKPQPET